VTPTTSSKPSNVQPTTKPKVVTTDPIKETSTNPLVVPPGQTKFSYAKGLYYQGKYKDAANLFSQVTKDEPLNSSAHRWLGDTYLKLSKKSQAVAEWKEFLRLDPNHSEANRVKEQIANNEK
jgi:TolA-binding protein